MHLIRNITVAAALAVTLGLQAHAQEEQEKATEQWRSERLRQPAAVEHDNADASWANAARRSMLAKLNQASPERLLGPDPMRYLVAEDFRPYKHDEGLYMAPGDSQPGSVPAWLQEAVARRVAALSAPSATVPTLQRGQWLGRMDPGYSKLDPRGAAVWAGPAVRDGVASYQADGKVTRIRLNIGEPLSLWKLARARGAAVRLALDDGGQALLWEKPLPIRMSMALPVWIVTPQELIAATLTEIRSGSPCDGGHVELRIAGDRQPPVWAVLFLPDEASARSARVRRLPAPPSDPNSSASQVSRLELSWTDSAMPALHLVAKRFGELWGSYAQLAGPPGQETERLSAAGSPECAPR